MNHTSPLILIPPIALLFTASFGAMTDASQAGLGTDTIVDITFESTAPYYQPPMAVVPAGVPVRWLNTTASHHSIRHDECLTDGPCAFESIAVSPDSSFMIAPLPAGRYAYHCELHPVMRGTLIVTDPNRPDTTAWAGGETRN